jgi:hypothetical protein
MTAAETEVILKKRIDAEIAGITAIVDAVLDPGPCEVELVSGPYYNESAYPCRKAHWAPCEDCGRSLCHKHTRECHICHQAFCSECLDAHINGCEG